MESTERRAEGGRRFPRRILMATSLSVHSDRAFDRAAGLARAAGAHLRVVHAVEPGLLPESYVVENMERARRDAERDLRECGTPVADAAIEILLGEPAGAILEDAVSSGADLIVMGLSRETTLARAFRGTTTAQVARRSPCPVLAVKRRPVRAYERILVALDLQPASVAALDFVLSAFPDARLTIVHVDESTRPRDEVADEVAMLVSSRCAEAGVAGPGSAAGPTVTVLAAPTALGLPEAIEDLQPDLVAVGTHGRTGVAGFLLGSVAESLLDTLAFDFLIARGGDR